MIDLDRLGMLKALLFSNDPEDYEVLDEVVAYIPALEAERDHLQERLKQAHKTCDVCWTNSWMPSENGEYCENCASVESLLKYDAENKKLLQQIRSWKQEENLWKQTEADYLELIESLKDRIEQDEMCNHGALHDE